MLAQEAAPVSVTQCFRDAEGALRAAAEALAAALDDSAGMAGCEAPAWVTQYDPVARSTATAVGLIATGCSRMAPMLEETWILYGTADRQSFRAYAAAMLPHPGGALPPLVEVPAPPEAAGPGGSGRLGVSFWLRPVVSLLSHWVHWPTCDIDRLQRTGDAWHALADAIGLAFPSAQEGWAALQTYRAPGLGAATQIAATIVARLAAIQQAAQALAESCWAYADAASELEAELVSRVQHLVEAVGLVALIGLLSSLVSAGGGGAAAGDATAGVVTAWIADAVALIGSTEARVALAAGCLGAVPLVARGVPDFSGVRLPGVEVRDQIATMASEPGLGDSDGAATPETDRGAIPVSKTPRPDPELAAETRQSLLRIAATVLRDDAPVDQSWGSMRTLSRHLKDHGADFGISNTDSYARAAAKFFRDGVANHFPTKVDTDGVIRLYDTSTNTFAAFNKDGTIRTYFKPTRAGLYWKDQPGVSIQ